ncbi:MAG: prephenate dehydrogenase/arogenate dehydrogenase family protein [Candidatus Heimdallarchaeota archaeon]
MTQLVISILGAGGMGQWLANFFKDEAKVKIYDINLEKAIAMAQRLNIQIAETTKELVSGCHILILAIPIMTIKQVIDELLPLLHPDMALIDIAGIKSPILNSLKKAAKSTNVLSIHPLFGPTATTIQGKILVLMPVTEGVNSHPEIRKITEIFIRNGARIVEMRLESHDERLSHTLNLAHLLNIAFAMTLRNSNQSISSFLQLATTTFSAQLILAEAVAIENVKHYTQLQIFNPYSISMLDQLINTLTEIRKVMSKKDTRTLEQILKQNREFLAEDPHFPTAKIKVYHFLERV